MKKISNGFKNGQEAISKVEELVAGYKGASYLEKANWLKRLEDLNIPEEFTGARQLRDRYVKMTPETAMQRAMSLVQSFNTLGPKEYPMPRRLEAKSMLEGLPKDPKYDSVRDLLRHYANGGD